MHCSEKNGKQTTRMVSYCAYHRYGVLNYDNIVSPFSLYILLPLRSFLFPNLKKLQCFLNCGYECIWVHHIFILAVQLHDFYISCRAPNPDTVLIIQTPQGVISTKILIQKKRKVGSRLISSNRIKEEETPLVDNIEHDPFSAARCRVFVRINRTKKVTWKLFFFFLMNVCKIINQTVM